MIHRLAKFAIFCTVVSGFSFSQVPTLDPEQTVNKATGEMGFSLPLGVVKGINGHGYPINLNYKAGIQTNQEASSAGLGFSCEGGSITRKMIFVPDDYVVNSAADYHHKETNYFTESDEIKALRNFLNELSAIITIASFGSSGGLDGIIGTIANFAISAAQTGINAWQASNLASLSNYKNAGPQAPVYNWSSGNGNGFFNPNGGDDLPDVYMVNTPFISGELVWVGTRQNGYFAFRNAFSASGKNMQSVKVEYDFPVNGQDIFHITLPDGTKLHFENTNSCPMHFFNFGSKDVSGGGYVSYCSHVVFNRPVVTKWNLTKIEYPSGDNITLNYNLVQPFAQGWSIWGESDLTKQSPWSFCQFFYGSSQLASNYYDQYGYPDAATSSLISINLLNSIESNNQKAFFTYEEREDNILHKNKPLVSGYYKQPTKLTKIEIKDKNENMLRRILFKTDYSLRQRNIPSYLHPGEWWIGPLTLNAVQIADNLGNVLPDIVFTYSKNPQKQSNYLGPFSMTIKYDNGSEAISYGNYHCEERDLWNYYSARTTCSDWNVAGLKNRTIDQDVWSVSSVTLPNGESITWQYEPHRYKYVNGVSVSSADGPKFGGGIRVKKVTVDDGLHANQPLEISYFYTKATGVFDENSGGSSGYASVEPFYYLSTNDARADKTKGGLYTPAYVAYQKVQVVKNYRETVPHAPFGYAVNEFTHAGDPAVAGYHSNGGIYGEVDSSWERGLLISQQIYDKNSKVISQINNSYEFLSKMPMNFQNSDNIFNLLLSIPRENTYGWIKLKKTEKKKDGVTTSSDFKYAPDVSTSTLDDIIINNKDISVYDAGAKIPSGLALAPYDRAVACKTRKWGVSDIDDYILVKTNGTSLMWISIGKDISPQNPNNWTAWEDYGSGTSIEQYVIGTELWDMDGDGNVNDLIVVNRVPAYGGSSTWMLFIYVFYDIDITSGGFVTYRGLSPTETRIKTPGGAATFFSSHDPDNDWPSGCMIGNFDPSNNGKPDFLLFTNSGTNHSRFPGDRRTDKGRYIYAITNFTATGGEVTPEFWSTAGRINYFGNAAFFTNADGGATLNDLVIVGPGRIYDGSTGGTLDRPFAFQKFNNLRFNGGQIELDPCSNCSGDSYQLFNGLPNGTWDRTKFAGVFNFEGDNHQQFWFFSEESDKPYFYIVDQTPFSFSGDYDGQPNEIWETNSDGKKRITTPIPAYWKYPEMGDPTVTGNKHILTANCQTIAYEKAKSDASTDLKATDARSSQVTAWNKLADVANGVWLPCSTYIWNVPTNPTTGFPTQGIGTFNFTSAGANGATWKFKGGVSKYNSFNIPIENTVPFGVGLTKSNSMVYGTAVQVLPIGAIFNAHFKESGVFTCDYNLNEPGAPRRFFDKNNGWEIGVLNQSPYPPIGSISAASPHFGQYSLHMTNGEGLMRNFKVRGNMTYELSLWVNVVSGSMPIRVEYRKETSPITDWPIQYNNPLLTDYDLASLINKPQGPTNGAWNLVKIPIPVSSGNDNWIRISIGFHNATFYAYIDDVRFAPTNALVTSTYYDQLWQMPILTVDASGNPGKVAEYDCFGRLISIFKIDKKRSRGYLGADTIVQHKTYHLMKETGTFPDPNKWYKITSNAAAKLLDADISGAGIGNGSKAQVWSDGTPANRQWKFQEASNGKYRIVCREKPNYAIAADVNAGDLNGSTHGSVKMAVIGCGQNFQWTLQPVSGQTDVYQIISPYISSNNNLPLVLDADNTGDGVDDGHVVQVWENGNQEANQQWILTEVPSAPNESFLPYDPTPMEEEMYFSFKGVTLEWKCDPPSGKDLNYDVYWGTDRDNLSKLNTGGPITNKFYTYSNGLESNTTYYWMVVAREVVGGKLMWGPVWKFTTIPLEFPEGWRACTAIGETFPFDCLFSWDCLTSSGGRVEYAVDWGQEHSALQWSSSESSRGCDGTSYGCGAAGDVDYNLYGGDSFTIWARIIGFPDSEKASPPGDWQIPMPESP